MKVVKGLGHCRSDHSRRSSRCDACSSSCIGKNASHHIVHTHTRCRNQRVSVLEAKVAKVELEKEGMAMVLDQRPSA